MAFCNMCGTQIADGTTTCAACSSRAAGASTVATANAGMNDNVAGLLAYITIIPAIVFLVLAPYNQSRFVRFHSFQCIFICVAAFVVHIGLMLIGAVPLMIFITGPLHLLVTVATIILLIVCALKANQGQMYKLPVIGDMAEKQAGAM